VGGSHGGGPGARRASLIDAELLRAPAWLIVSWAWDLMVKDGYKWVEVPNEEGEPVAAGPLIVDEAATARLAQMLEEEG
jgi:hypothetical protein